MIQLQEKVLPPEPLSRFCHFQKAFTDDELKRIVFFEKIANFSDANELNPDYKRICKVGGLQQDHNSEWIYDKVGTLAAQANYSAFLYNIDAFEPLQYTIYESPDAEYDWHRDIILSGYRKLDRKISCVIMLSDPSEYEGGDFEIDMHGILKPETLKLEKGDVIFFDSHVSHRVTTITSGVRKTLNTWIWGDMGNV